MKRSTGKGLGVDQRANYTLYEFDSVIEYATFVRQNGGSHSGSDRPSKGNFNATESLAQACDFAVNGWDELRPQLDAILEPLRHSLAEVLTVNHERQYDLVGSDIDIDAYYAGELEYMFELQPVEERAIGKVFTILVDTGMTVMNDATDIIRRGVAVVALVEAFSLLGYSLEVWSESTIIDGYNDHEFMSRLVKLASAGEPLDINNLMFPLGNGDWHRRLGFAHLESVPDGRKYVNNSYGCSGNGVHFQERVNANTSLEVGDSFKRNSALFDSDPTAWVLSQLETAGVWKVSE